jgi:DNA-binding NarL/FixJ family response regulator
MFDREEECVARPWRRITPEKRREIVRLAARGATYDQIAQSVDLSSSAVALVVKPLGGVIRREMWEAARVPALAR